MSKSQVGGGNNRSKSKGTNRKKRNLYTSVGNYYQSTGQNYPANSGSRVTKRMHPNFLENLEQTNVLNVSNQLYQGDVTKKRNKSSTKSYNNKEQLDNSDMSYSNHVNKKNMTNNFVDISQFGSNQNSIVKNFENSFSFGKVAHP